MTNRNDGKFVMVPSWVRRCPELGPTDLAVMWVLCEFSNRKSWVTTVSQSAVARELRLSLPTVKRSYVKLASVGAITVTRRGGDGQGPQSNITSIVWESTASDPESEGGLSITSDPLPQEAKYHPRPGLSITSDPLTRGTYLRKYESSEKSLGEKKKENVTTTGEYNSASVTGVCVPESGSESWTLDGLEEPPVLDTLPPDPADELDTVVVHAAFGRNRESAKHPRTAKRS